MWQDGLKLGETKWVAQGHTARWWLSQQAGAGLGVHSLLPFFTRPRGAVLTPLREAVRFGGMGLHREVIKEEALCPDDGVWVLVFPTPTSQHHDLGRITEPLFYHLHNEDGSNIYPGSVSQANSQCNCIGPVLTRAPGLGVDALQLKFLIIQRSSIIQWTLIGQWLTSGEGLDPWLILSSPSHCLSLLSTTYFFFPI